MCRNAGEGDVSDLKLPKPLTKGYKRQWVQCGTCGTVSYYDYIPYSLSNPIMVMPCNHRFDDVARISHSEAMYLLYPRLFGIDEVMESAFAGLADALEAQGAELLQEVMDLWDVWGWAKSHDGDISSFNGSAISASLWSDEIRAFALFDSVAEAAEWVRQQEGET